MLINTKNCLNKLYGNNKNDHFFNNKLKRKLVYYIEGQINEITYLQFEI